MSTPDLTALYAQLSPESQRCLDEINFLATELRTHLLPEQFIMAVNAITQRLQQVNPTIACPTGCARCCEAQEGPHVTPLEAEWVKGAIQALEPEHKARVQEQIQQQIQQDTPGCALLVDGQCSVYAMRPLDCRLKGYSFDGDTPYTCHTEQQRMEVELRQQHNPLGYVFMPQRAALKQVFSELQAADAPTLPLRDFLRVFLA